MDETKHYFQIDILKGLAIISVILLHSISTSAVKSPLSIFTIYQAVPVFFCIMGINAAMSFKRRNYSTLQQLYSLNSFAHRAMRLLYPILLLALLYVVFLGLGIDFRTLQGPGDYFIYLVIQFLFIFPLIYFFYEKNWKATLIISIIVSIAFEIWGTSHYGLYRCGIFRYLFIIILGIWVSENLDIDKVKSVFSKSAFLGLNISVIYLGIVSFLNYSIPYFVKLWQPQIFISFLYPVFLCIIGLVYLPKRGNKSALIAQIGRYSYHIFLIQISFFGSGLTLTKFIYNYELGIGHYLLWALAILGNLIITIIAGYIFFKFEIKSEKILKKTFRLFGSHNA